jgi:hypothetical protein
MELLEMLRKELDAMNLVIDDMEMKKLCINDKIREL